MTQPKDQSTKEGKSKQLKKNGETRHDLPRSLGFLGANSLGRLGEQRLKCPSFGFLRCEACVGSRRLADTQRNRSLGRLMLTISW